jgi:hypothetical protein
MFIEHPFDNRMVSIISSTLAVTPPSVASWTLSTIQILPPPGGSLYLAEFLRRGLSPCSNPWLYPSESNAYSPLPRLSYSLVERHTTGQTIVAKHGVLSRCP